MVLRAVDPLAATLTFFADARSAKVAAIAADPRVAVVAWDPAALLQLRLRGAATIATAGPAVARYWRTVPPAAQRAYRTVAAPGTPLAQPPAALADDVAAFAVLTVAVEAMDLLDLATDGHIRVAAYRSDGRWQAGWSVP